MDNPSGPSPSKDAQDLPEWANWPLRPDGTIDVERLMPTTFRVFSKEYCRSRQDLTASLSTLTPKRPQETKSIPVISNLTLLELYDLSGEEIIDFRAFVLETLGEIDRMNSRERLMTDHNRIKQSMMELRRVANEIHNKKSRDESNAFLTKRANLAILGYFTRRDPRNMATPSIPRPFSRQFKEFLFGNKGAARISAYNWRHKKWDESVNRNLNINPDRVVEARMEGIPIIRIGAKKEKTPELIMPKREEQDDSLQSDTVDENGKSPVSSLTVSPPEPPQISLFSRNSKKMRMGEGFNLKNAIVKGRDEVNFYCAVRANKVNPGGFGLPKGFVRCGDKIVHHTKTDKVDMSGNARKRKREMKKTEKKEEEANAGEEWMDKSSPSSTGKDNEDVDLKNPNGWNEIQVVMDDIEEDDDVESDIDICDEKPPVFQMDSSMQTEENDVMRTGNGDTVMNPEIAAQLDSMRRIHAEDMGIIQKLRMENALALKNLSKYHNKTVSLMMDRNNIKCNLNLLDRDRKAEKFQNVHLTKQVKMLTSQNTALLDEVKSLKREIGMRDHVGVFKGDVGRYEEFSG